MSTKLPVLALTFAATGALLFALSGPAGATLWQPVQTGDKAQTEVDLDSISKKDAIATAWVQEVHAEPIATKSGAYYVYRTMKMQIRYQCTPRTAAVLTRGYFNDSGAEVAVEHQAEEARPVLPETAEDHALTLACAADPKKAATALKRPEPVAERYMDGLARTEHRAGLIRASAPATAPLPDGPAAAVAAPLAPEHHAKPAGTLAKERITRPLPAGDHGHDDAHWDYEGENAPYRWGDMKPDYAACKTGQRQSPIDIRNPVLAALDPITFHYEESPLKVTNNGHTIQVDLQPGSFILVSGERYELVQLHFHTPSEERINGRGFDMVAHLVHKSAQGKLAVVAVLLTAGQAHAAIENIWNTMPGTPGRTRERPEVQFNPLALLPADRAYYSFQGSLTTPPCTEGVQWLVLKTPVELAREQIVHFNALYPMNARPLQPANDRIVKAGS